MYGGMVGVSKLVLVVVFVLQGVIVLVVVVDVLVVLEFVWFVEQ